MDPNLEAIESLLTGSPIRIESSQKNTPTAGRSFTDQVQELNFMRGVTMSEEREKSSWEWPPGQKLQLSTPSRQKLSFAMKTPGYAIPTPAPKLHIDRQKTSEMILDTSDGGEEEAMELHPTDSFEALAGNTDSSFDDSDFLPADFGVPFTPARANKENFQLAKSAQKSNSPVLSSAQIQAKIDEAVDVAKKLWLAQETQRLEEEITERVQKEAHEQLEKHGAAWSAEHEEEVARLQSQMDAIVEKRKAQLELEFAEKLERKAQSIDNGYASKIQGLICEHASQMENHQKVLDQVKDTSETRTFFLKDRVLELELELTNTTEESERTIQELKATVDRLRSSVYETTDLMEAEHAALVRKMIENHAEDCNRLHLGNDQAVEAAKSVWEQGHSLKLSEEMIRLQSEHKDALANIVDLHTCEIEQLRNDVTNHLYSIDKLRDEMNVAKADYTEEIHQMKKENESLQKELAERTKASIEMEHDILKLQTEIDDLLSKEAQNQVDLNTTYEAQISRLQAELKTTRDVSSSEHKAEIESLMAQRATEKEAQTMAFESEKKAFEDRLANLEESLLRSSAMQATAVAEIENKHAQKLEQITIALEEERSSLAIQLQQKDELASKIQLLEVALSSLTTEQAGQIAHIKACHDSELNAIDLEREKQLDDLRVQLERRMAETLSHLSDVAAREKTLLDKVSQLEAEADQAQGDVQRRVQELRKEHSSEIDELISQLDLVEAENKKEFTVLENKMKQKDAIIAALGTQLAEATSRSNELDAEHQNAIEALQAAKEEAHLAKLQCATFAANLERSKIEYKKAIEDEKRKRQDAREEVRAGMILAAEEQFAKANMEYLRLKSEFESTLSKLGKTEREFKVVSVELEAAKKEHITKEVEMTAELAQARATVATNEAVSARKVQEYSLEIERLNTTHQELQAKLDDSFLNCKAAHQSLGTIVAEKEQLAKENRDLKEVCEELMAMVEAEKLS